VDHSEQSKTIYITRKPRNGWKLSARWEGKEEIDIKWIYVSGKRNGGGFRSLHTCPLRTPSLPLHLYQLHSILAPILQIALQEGLCPLSQSAVWQTILLIFINKMGIRKFTSTCDITHSRISGCMGKSKTSAKLDFFYSNP